jgi:hypothetical protein
MPVPALAGSKRTWNVVDGIILFLGVENVNRLKHGNSFVFSTSAGKIS